MKGFDSIFKNYLINDENLNFLFIKKFSFKSLMINIELL